MLGQLGMAMFNGPVEIDDGKDKWTNGKNNHRHDAINSKP
jgi:hypothetical protein